jgi:hypothetical protein
MNLHRSCKTFHPRLRLSGIQTGCIWLTDRNPLRRLFQTISPTSARRKRGDAKHDAYRRIEITIERELVEVIHPLGRTPYGADPEPLEAEQAGDVNRCPTCGHGFALGLSLPFLQLDRTQPEVLSPVLTQSHLGKNDEACDDA